MKNNLKDIIPAFFLWRIFLFAILCFSINNIPLNFNFLGGGMQEYLKSPYLWSFANFDGEHYLSIAYKGYSPLKYFFFPAYPLLISMFGKIFSLDFKMYAFTGILISNVSLVIALLGLSKLFEMDYKKKDIYFTLILLLVFPTSFYFGSLYNESVFLALVVWSFYFARRKKWLFSGVLGMAATATRLVGIALILGLLTEFILQRKKNKNMDLKAPALSLMMVPLGLLIYMAYLYLFTGDPLEFFHSVGIFGEQRTAGIVLLPQVFYRYIFKILPSINYDYFPVVFTTWLEFITALIFGLISVIAFFKTRLSYAVYLFSGFLIPTFSGSFSSLPRYVLVLFPAFLIAAFYVGNLPKTARSMLILISFIGLAVATSLFVRGYWVS